jgi:hypothetical protein
MDTMLLRIFQGEVERQCKFALLAVSDLDDAIVSMALDRIWYSVQSFLVATGNVSKLLWPEKPRSASRGEILRQSLSVDTDSPLAPRTFRNHFEHFDERLERWAASWERQNFVDSNVLPEDAITDLATSDYLRDLDPVTKKLTFRGDEYLLRPMIDAVSKLWERANIAASAPYWKDEVDS